VCMQITRGIFKVSVIDYYVLQNNGIIEACAKPWQLGSDHPQWDDAAADCVEFFFHPMELVMQYVTIGKDIMFSGGSPSYDPRVWAVFRATAVGQWLMFAFLYEAYWSK
jgi:hypothetical protein